MIAGRVGEQALAMQVQEENVTNWLLGQATTEEVPVEFDKVMKGEF
jgi:trigger factor